MIAVCEARVFVLLSGIEEVCGMRAQRWLHHAASWIPIGSSLSLEFAGRLQRLQV
jgi:hypothetical protein